MQTQRQQAHTIMDALNTYRERISTTESQNTVHFSDIKNLLIQTKKDGKRVLIDTSDLNYRQAVIITLDYVGDYYAMGYSPCYDGVNETMVPHTLSYSDLYAKQDRVKIIIEGENPFAVPKDS